MSLVSGSVTGPKKKRPRKSKGGGKGDDESINDVGARAKSAISGEGGRGVSVEEEEDDGDQTALATVANTNEETQKEKTKLALLTQSFDEDQWKRYEAWRSSKLSDAVVRRVCYSSSFNDMAEFADIVIACESNALAICSDACYFSG
jgi:transcription initiation factor TFIID subunit 11